MNEFTIKDVAPAPADLPGLYEDAAPTDSYSGFGVALVCMPFGSAQRPSIQLALLAAIAERAGFRPEVIHFNLDLARRMTPSLYEEFCEHRGHMTGEWLFARAAFGSEAPATRKSYFEAFPSEARWAESIGQNEETLCEMQHELLPQFIDECVASRDWSRFRVVGFSSTFQQNTASLALARRIKQLFPGVLIVFGGANMEGEMGREVAHAFPFVDYVVSGEGDTVFPQLLVRLAGAKSAAGMRGVLANTAGGVTDGGAAAPVHDLNALPVPNYSHYFARADELGLLTEYQSLWSLPVEGSRGCWWGQKHHCTFCGLNGEGMAYRSKTPARFLEELTELATKHRISAFTAVDNILDLKYLAGLFTGLAQTRTDYLFFFEVKANLDRAQIQTLYNGGVRRIQPGIESMSTNVLRLMRKGCTMLQNVQCLKWCRYYKINVDWNLIWGFPGESIRDYEMQLDVLGKITHLEPPLAASRIWLERFSPFFNEREQFSLSDVQAEASYRYVYPRHVDVDKLAYFFDYRMGDTVSEGAHQETVNAVAEWRRSWESADRHTLSYRRTGAGILIDYNRGPERRGTYQLSGAPAALYEHCVETPRTVAQLSAHLSQIPGERKYEDEEIREAMDEFCEARLMLSEGGKYFSLALPSNPNW